MTDMRAERPTMGEGWGWIMAYGIVSALVGVAAFLWPFAATVAATVTIGAFFFISGVFAIAAGLFGHGHESRAYSIAFGLVSVIVGTLMVLEPATGAISLTLMVAVWLAVRGVLEVYWGFKARRRGLMIALGAVNLLLAAFIVATVPWSALTLPAFVLGTSFLMGGITAIAAAWDHRVGARPFGVPAA